jgi:hypothetical protein
MSAADKAEQLRKRQQEMAAMHAEAEAKMKQHEAEVAAMKARFGAEMSSVKGKWDKETTQMKNDWEAYMEAEMDTHAAFEQVRGLEEEKAAASPWSPLAARSPGWRMWGSTLATLQGPAASDQLPAINAPALMVQDHYGVEPGAHKKKADASRTPRSTTMFYSRIEGSV